MEFIGSLTFEKIPGFLDSDEEVALAGDVLQQAVCKLFEKHLVAGMLSWQKAREIILD